MELLINVNAFMILLAIVSALISCTNGFSLHASKTININRIPISIKRNGFNNCRLSTDYSRCLFETKSLQSTAKDANVESSGYETDLARTGQWIAAALGFAGFLSATKGVDSGVEFCSGYLLELSLSVDNLFVFLVLFDYFSVKSENQDRILSYGIWGGTYVCL